MSAVAIRPALLNEADALTALCVRSKAHWGHDRAFLEKALPELTVRPEWIEAGLVLVAEHDGTVAGVAGITDEGGGKFDISVFFVDPPFMGRGIGRALFEALTGLARGRDARLVTILADPDAEPFYLAMGARTVGHEPSEATGRTLPLMHLTLRPGSR